MARNGSGTYSLPLGDRVADTVITASWANTTMDDLATAMTASIAKDGQTNPTANLPMNSKKHTGVAVAANLTDYLDAKAAVDSKPVILTSVSGTNTIVGTAAYSCAAYVAGQKFHFKSAAANTGATTLNVNSIGAKTIKTIYGAALTAGMIENGTWAVVIYNAADNSFRLQGGDVYRVELLAGGALSTVAADDITTGDAAVTLATSAGNITVDAQGSDTDIIFKGTDGGVDTTFLTLDGSAAGNAAFNGSITVADGGNVGSATTPTAIDIISTGQIGVGNSGYANASIYAYNNVTNSHALRAQNDHASSTYSVIYVTNDGSGAGIDSRCAGANNGAYLQSTAGYGVYGKTLSASSAGVIGYSASGSNYGLLGHANAHGCYASSGYFIGALYKGSGTFRIPHGLREGHDLLHSFVEGPQCDLIYRGRATLVDGQATISMDTKYGMTPGTFVWLTKDIQTFTSNETGWDAVKSSFSGDTITIECQNADSTDTISWMVVAERDDPNIKASEITDDDGNLIIERPSEPEPPLPPIPQTED